jgi:hypothetical protein
MIDWRQNGGQITGLHLWSEYDRHLYITSNRCSIRCAIGLLSSNTLTFSASHLLACCNSKVEQEEQRRAVWRWQAKATLHWLWRRCCAARPKFIGLLEKAPLGTTVQQQHLFSVSPTLHTYKLCLVPFVKKSLEIMAPRLLLLLAACHMQLLWLQFSSPWTKFEKYFMLF